ncbi:hypothetical protein [Photobacterium leiognathi]|uniref:hypothetical protein n=1 Tax=Photobacterium leiognathi TaxID=553611 RepID=UPI0029816DA8|nr:hypothetical protein [Photobacterium leiognathi]
MWLIGALTVSLLAIYFWFQKAQKDNNQLKKQFEQIMMLRQLIEFIRYHRRFCHQKLAHPNINVEFDESVNVKTHIMKETLTALIHLADSNHKPMFRILRKEIQTLLTECQEYTLQRSQAIHGRIIRHIMYLIDDVVSSALLTSEKDHAFEHYQAAWPIILNSLDNLHRFRWTIDHYPIKSNIYQRELKIHIKMIQRRLGQIQMLSQQQPPTWPIEKLLPNFLALSFETPDEKGLKEGLYRCSFQISDTIFQYFDLILADIADELTIEAPSLTACLADHDCQK